jgi:hypothetical protein
LVAQHWGGVGIAFCLVGRSNRWCLQRFLSKNYAWSKIYTTGNYNCRKELLFSDLRRIMGSATFKTATQSLKYFYPPTRYLLYSYYYHFKIGIKLAYLTLPKWKPPMIIRISVQRLKSTPSRAPNRELGGRYLARSIDSLHLLSSPMSLYKLGRTRLIEFRHGSCRLSNYPYF